MAELAVRAERQDGRIRLIVTGELDLATVGILQDAAAAELAEPAPTEVVLDLAGLSFLDSSGLGALLRIRAEVLARGGELRIAAVAPGPARILDIAGLSGTFGLPQP